LISSDFLKRRKAELAEGLHNPKTAGKPWYEYSDLTILLDPLSVDDVPSLSR
jgi:hypothetical protein